MIRPLRRRHRWLLPALMLGLAAAAALSLAYPAPDGRVDALPAAVDTAAERPR